MPGAPALAGSWVGDSLPKVVPEDAEFLAMVGGFAVAQVLWIHRSEAGSRAVPGAPALAGIWVGDSLPKVMPQDAEFLAMVGGFAVAQVLWIVAFTRVDRGRSPIAWTLLLVVVAVALLAVTVPAAGVLTPAVVVYGLLLLAVAWLASSHGWVGALFVLSDGLIALGAFRPELVNWVHRDLVVMATYVAAQALFVATILLTRSPDRTFARSPRRGTCAGGPTRTLPDTSSRRRLILCKAVVCVLHQMNHLANSTTPESLAAHLSSDLR